LHEFEIDYQLHYIALACGGITNVAGATIVEHSMTNIEEGA